MRIRSFSYRSAAGAFTFIIPFVLLCREATRDGSLSAYLLLLLRNKRSLQQVQSSMQELLQDEYVTGSC